MSMPLAESGYYVLPVVLVDTTFKENGLNNPAEIQQVSPAKLREIFGADAALYSTVKEYGSTYKLLSSTVNVAIDARLVDLKTGATLWAGSARASSAENEYRADNSLAAKLVGAMVDQIVHSIVDNSHQYAGVAAQRLLSAQNGRIPYGPLSVQFNKE